MKTYTTPEVAKLAQTTPRAIRLWESKGLFGKVERKFDDRRFTESQLQRARIISVASMIGMTLEEIKNSSNSDIAWRAHPIILFMRTVVEDIGMEARKGFDL